MIGCENCGRTDGDILDSRFGSLCYLCFQDAANGEEPPEVEPVEGRLKARYGAIPPRTAPTPTAGTL